jgi:hypothetical protein
MLNKSQNNYTGIIGMFGAALFFVGLLIEYRFGLFPPGTGTLFILNQVQFFVAMGCIFMMLWEMRKVQAGGNGRFARISLTIFPIGWVALILGGIVSLLTGNDENLFFPLGGLTVMVFGLLAGIAVVMGKKWHGWSRFAPLIQGLYYLIVMMILPPVLTGSNEPTLLTESLWMATWFLMSLAVYVNGRQVVGITAVA